MKEGEKASRSVKKHAVKEEYKKESTKKVMNTKKHTKKDKYGGKNYQ